jgi:hypothetical protein
MAEGPEAMASEEFLMLPDWAQNLIGQKTPYLASDPEFQIVQSRYSFDWVQFKSRGFLYVANRYKQQIV